MVDMKRRKTHWRFKILGANFSSANGWLVNTCLAAILFVYLWAIALLCIGAVWAIVELVYQGIDTEMTNRAADVARLVAGSSH